ncbi:TrkA C-terminal domain-containing protein [Priestia megaterium]|uniref:TrkA C-terminal domain-containing protein n=1 Tax=Priestia megaterium TaxID=1404 RepID=UPI002731A464|nr:TrkA C-terminal domain-containing protein [Priestia megaterium]MDP1383446.1 TrkA C-terminal domain-containing protein [Priestia megaterium]MDP1427595.1 TrkA C-terminal domain-containing protein [Priestia megaterium]MED4135974.1 TrkA C-terminal domain-containing protein [Priestia megaterium]
MEFTFTVIYLVIIATIIEINTILFSVTGIKRQVARFQVISLMTGTGFTTGESEVILGHPFRRRLGIFLILFGAFSFAVIISSLSNILSNDVLTPKVLYIEAGLIFLFFLLKLPFFQKVLSDKFKEKSEETFEIDELPVSQILLTDEADCLLEIKIDEKSSYIRKSVNECIHKEEDILVLFLMRGELRIRNKLNDCKIQAGDRLLVYGNKQVIEEKFREEIKKAEKETV